MANERKQFCIECRKETTYQIRRVPYKKVIKDKEYTLDELFNGLVKIRPDVLKDFPTLHEEAIWLKLKMYIKNL